MKRHESRIGKCTPNQENRYYRYKRCRAIGRDRALVAEGYRLEAVEALVFLAALQERDNEIRARKDRDIHR
jgi:hypothetical protein